MVLSNMRCTRVWWSVIDCLSEQASDVIDELSQQLPALAAWPVDALAGVVHESQPAKGFRLAAAWMAAQRQPAKQRHHWPRLLDVRFAVRFEN